MFAGQNEGRMDAREVRRWIAGFEAIAQADREELRRRGPDPAWAISLVLSMMAAADRAGRGLGAADPGREAEDEAVRAIWARLRERARR
jgi:hypothetical protein